MKVKELIEELKTLNQDSEIYLQIDSEGNGYNKCRGVDGNSIYYNYSVYSDKWTARECCMEDKEHEDLLNRTRCVVLFP